MFVYGMSTPNDAPIFHVAQTVGGMDGGGLLRWGRGRWTRRNMA